MSVELTAVCTLSVLKIAVLYRTLRPDSYCFAPCIAIYSAERKGQAGAELLLCPGERGYFYMALGLWRIRQRGSRCAWSDLAWPDFPVQQLWLKPLIFVQYLHLKSHCSWRKKDGPSFFWFWNCKDVKPVVQQVQQCWESSAVFSLSMREWENLGRGKQRTLHVSLHY